MMQNSELQSIHERLGAVEKQNHWLKYGVVAVLLVVGGLLTTMRQANSSSRDVEAEKFVVKDSNGKVLAEISGGGIVFYDPNGNARIRVGELSNFSSAAVLNSPGIGLYDEGGQRKIVLTSTGKAMELKFETGDTTWALNSQVTIPKSIASRCAPRPALTSRCRRAPSPEWRAPSSEACVPSRESRVPNCPGSWSR